MQDLRQRPGARFVKLATVGDIVVARVLAARLEAAGIETRVHSQALGPYPVTVGQLAESELWVLDDRLEEAGEILLDAEVNAVLHGVDLDEDETLRRTGPPWRLRLAALAITALLLTLVVMRLMRLAGM